ncbi:MAG: hypothetical protein J6M53_05565 [Bacteroidaceae bacterium]|nr:hypothetical protein [Bacteroidaceae bacterium]
MKNVLFLLFAVALVGCNNRTGGTDKAVHKTETIYQKVIVQQQVVPAPAPARPDIVLGEYVALSGVLNVDRVQFDLYSDYGEYSGTFTNFKMNVVWNVSGTLTPRAMHLVTVGEKSVWTFTATGDGQGNYSGHAKMKGGGGYNFKVHL